MVYHIVLAITISHHTNIPVILIIQVILILESKIGFILAYNMSGCPVTQQERFTNSIEYTIPYPKKYLSFFWQNEFYRISMNFSGGIYNIMVHNA